MQSKEIQCKKGDQLIGIVSRFSPLGVNVMLENGEEGLIYESEIFKRLYKGDSIKVYVKDIRTDGKITLSLDPIGYKNFINPTTQIILQALERNNGTLPLSDKSDPEDIYYHLQISKKKFKEALGALYKARKIEIKENEITLVK